MVCTIYVYIINISILILTIYYVFYTFYRVGGIGIKSIVDRFNIIIFILDETRQKDIVIAPDSTKDAAMVYLVYENRNHYTYLKLNKFDNKNNINGKNGINSPSLNEFKNIIALLNEDCGTINDIHLPPTLEHETPLISAAKSPSIKTDLPFEKIKNELKCGDLGNFDLDKFKILNYTDKIEDEFIGKQVQ